MDGTLLRNGCRSGSIIMFLRRVVGAKESGAGRSVCVRLRSRSFDLHSCLSIHRPSVERVVIVRD